MSAEASWGVALLLLLGTGAADSAEIPSLEAAWRHAESNSQMRSAQAQRDDADAQRRAAREKLALPALSAGVAYSDNLETPATDISGAFLGRRDTTLEMRMGHQYAASAFLDAQWNLLDISRWTQLSLAGSSIALANASLSRTRAEQRSRMAELYYAALARRDELSWSRRILELSDSLAGIAEARLEAGKSRPSQWRAAQDQRDEAASKSRQADLADREARLNLAEALDLPAGDNLVLSEQLVAESAGQIDSAFPAAPEVTEAETRTEVSRHQLAAARSQFLPVLSASWQVSRQIQSDGFADLSPSAKLQQVLSARLEIPISSGGDRRLAVRQASIELWRDRLELESSRRRRQAEDIKLLAELSTARQDWEAARLAAERRDQDDKDARELFASGSISLEERMKTSMALAQARSLESTQLSDYLSVAAKARIRAQGGRP